MKILSAKVKPRARTERSLVARHRSAWWLGAVALVCAGGTTARSQTLYSNNFGTTSISGTSYTGSPTLATGITNSAFTTSVAAGFTSYSGSSGMALGLANSGGTPTITLTLTLNGNYDLNLSSFSFWDQRSTSGAQAFTFSVNGTSVYTGGVVPTTGANTGSLTPSTTSFGGTSGLSTYTFTIGLSGASSTGTFRLDDFLLSGSLTAVGAPASGNYFGTTGQGYNASSTVFDTTTADFNSKNDGTGTAKAYDSTQAAVFGGTAGTVTVAAGGLTVGSGLQFDVDGYNLTGGTLTLSSTNTVQVTTSGTAATISSPLGGTAGLTKTGAGKLVLTGANGNTGTFTVNAGTLELNNGSNNLAGLSLTGGAAQIDAGSQVTLTNGALSVSSGAALTISGVLLNSSTTALAGNGGTVTVASGGMVIQQGNGSPTAFLFTGTTPAVFQPGSTFIFRDYTASPTASNRTYTGNLTFDSTGGAALTVGGISGTGTFTVNGDLTIGTGVTLPYSSGNSLTNAFKGNVTINGNLGGANGAQSITMLTGKTLAIGSGGVLAFATGQTLTVNSGATLQGTGSITGTGTTLVSGTLAPATIGTTGTITTGALTLDGTSTLAFDIVNTTTKDAVVVGTAATPGALTLGSGTLALTLPGTTGTSIDYTATYALFTNVSGVTGSFGTVTGYDTADYRTGFALNGTEYDLTFVPVPEPTTVLGGVLMIGAAGWSQCGRLRGTRRAA